jgi:phage gp29-like protein
MSSSSKDGIDSFISRFKPKEGARSEDLAKSAPTTKGADFDEYLANWTRFTGVSVKASTITRLLEGADDGQPAELAALFQTVIEKEPVIAAHLQTRLLAVLSCDWSVRCDDSAKALEIEAVLRKARVHSLLRHLLDAVATGYSGAATIWGEGGASVKAFKLIDSSNWVFDLAGNPALIGLDGGERALSSYHPHQFVFHTHLLKPGIPSRGGLLRSLVWLYFFKHYAMRDQARFLERFGMPFVLAKIRRDDFEDSSVRAGILASLSKVGADGAGVVTEGSEIQLLGASPGNPDYIEWFKYIDDVYATLILGQTASSKSTSGFSKGQIQENVRKEIVEADCRALMETLDVQLLRPLELYRYGTEGALRFVLDYSSPENLVDKAQIVKTLADAGFKAEPAWVSKTFGIALASASKRENSL